MSAVGADGGIDFDILRVMDEQKQICSLKNKGKYDIGYRLEHRILSYSTQ